MRPGAARFAPSSSARRLLARSVYIVRHSGAQRHVKSLMKNRCYFQRTYRHTLAVHTLSSPLPSGYTRTLRRSIL